MLKLVLKDALVLTQKVQVGSLVADKLNKRLGDKLSCF
jgi:hypothetical protein